jgi:FkbM family methyltransferase
MIASNFERWKKLNAEDKGYFFEFIVESAINTFVLTGDTCIDVGVNFGAHAHTMLSRVGSRGMVIGFEPNPTCYKALSQWPSYKQNFILHYAALSDRCGEGELYIAEENEISSLHESLLSQLNVNKASSIKVPLMRLDDLKISSCRFIKIDVDGEEFRCIKGAADTISRCRPIIFIEISWNMASDDTISNFCNWLKSINYSAIDCFHGHSLNYPLDDNWMVGLVPAEMGAESIKKIISESGSQYFDKFIGWNHYKKFERNK